MELSQNEQGQTLIHLSQEEWESYGKEAGFTQAGITKEASVSTDVIQKIASLQEDIQFHQKEINEKLVQLEAVTKSIQTEEVEEEAVTASTDPQPLAEEFNEENYPNLIAQQETEGLIGPFTKTSPCV